MTAVSTNPVRAGMTSRQDWKATAVHRASSYSCARCGKRFPTPHDFYEHLEGRCDPHPPAR